MFVIPNNIKKQYRITARIPGMREKVRNHLASTWMVDHIRYFHIDKKEHFINILH